MAMKPLLLLFVFLLSAGAGAHASMGSPEAIGLGLVLGQAQSNQCNGPMGECFDMMSNEFEMDSEVHRRILATSQYISYGALQANRVPCSQRGQSYYNCQPGATANPYTRGCSSIARCRR